MEIAFDAASNVFGGASTTETVVHTCAGSNRILYAFTVAANNVTGVTYNGVAMIAVSESGGGEAVESWYLINPAVGANNLVVTQDISGLLTVSGVSYTGANQSSQPDADNTGFEANANDITVSTISIADNCWGVMGVRDASAGDTTAGAGTTERGALSNLQVFDNNAAKTPPGTITLVANAGAGAPNPLTAAMLTIAPAVATRNRSKRHLLGMM